MSGKTKNHPYFTVQTQLQGPNFNHLYIRSTLWNKNTLARGRVDIPLLVERVADYIVVL